MGVANRVFARRDPSHGNHFVGTTQEIMGGIFMPLNETVVIRGEIRLRFDDHEDRGISNDLEQMLGVTLKL